MKTGNALLISVMLTVSTAANCQDLILKTDSSTLKVKVVEIRDADIKYKKFEFPEGPSYTISKNEVLKITYPNGSTETFAEADKTDLSYVFTSKLNLDDEKTQKKLQLLAELASKLVLATCTGKVTVTFTDVMLDAVMVDNYKQELVIPIKTNWQPNNNSDNTKWIKGTIRVTKAGKKTWYYTTDSAGGYTHCNARQLDL
jgi:hypothetical protein